MRFLPPCLALLLALGLSSCSPSPPAPWAGEARARPPLALSRPAVLCVADVTAMSGEQLRRDTPKGMRPFRLTGEEIGKIANGFWQQLTDRLAADRAAGVTLTGEPVGADCLLTVTLSAFGPDHAPTDRTGPGGKGLTLPILAVYRFADRDGRTVWEGRSLVGARLGDLAKGNGLEDLGGRYGDEVFSLLK